MRTFKKVLNGKGLLAASIAMLSGHALAETAGRVSFVSGDAAVTAKDGSQRALQRGDAINGGDRITTRAGRVQIRFTDGGFVSLQPNTVFGVDEYLYANRKPEETSLFFSLIQGGMRTITGAIGKVNKKSYAVRTPVATIGIRGTEYQAVVTPEGLKVSVGSGFVNVANEGGEVTGAARQVIRVTKPNSAPELTDEEIELLSTRSDGRERRLGQGEEGDRTVTISDVQNDRGDYLFLFTTVPSLPDSVYPNGPVYRVMSPYASNSPYSSALYANFDQNGATTGSQGGVLQLFDPYVNTSSVLVPNQVFDSGSLKVVNSGTIDALSWGEFTNGEALNNVVFSGPTNPLLLTGTQYLPYIIGAPTAELPAKGYATYTLEGATPARLESDGTAGTLDSFIIRVNLDLAAMDAVLKVTMPTNSYTVATASSVSLSSGSPAFAALGPTAAPGGNFGFSTTNLIVSDANGNCASGSTAGGCSAELAGFFAGPGNIIGPGGSQIGASYAITDPTLSGRISGTAALGLAAYASAAPYLPDSTAGVYYEMRYGLMGLGSWPSGTREARFDQDGSVTGVVGGLKAMYGWNTSFTSYGKTFDSGSLSIVNSGTVGTLSWGEFTNGASATGQTEFCTDGCASDIILSSTEYLPYIIGVSSSGNLGLHKGSATYTLQGGTPARDMLGRSGTLNSFSVKLDLDFNTIQAAFSVSMPAASVPDTINGGTLALVANTYNVSTKAPLAVVDLPTLGTFDLNSFQLAVTDTQGNCGSGSTSSCSAAISGFFTGTAHEQIGAAYWLSDASGAQTSDIYGVAALALTSTSSATTLASGPAYSVAFATPSNPGINGGFAGNGFNVTFDPAMSMTTATGFDPLSGAPLTVMDRGTALTAETGGVGTLEWGRWYGNSTDVNGTAVIAGQNTVTLSPTQSVSYVVGPMSQSSAFYDVLSQFGEGATATYTYQGGTAAVGSDGVLGTVKAGSTLQMTFSWSAPTLAMNIGIDMQSGNDYDITGNAMLGLDSTVSKFSALSGSGASCTIAGGSTGCSASISGFFAGQQAQQIGLGYNVNDGGRTVSGAAAFGRGDITAATLP